MNIDKQIILYGDGTSPPSGIDLDSPARGMINLSLLQRPTPCHPGLPTLVGTGPGYPGSVARTFVKTKD